MKALYYSFFVVFFVSAVFAHCATNEQVIAWAKVFDVLAGLVVVFYIATLKFTPKTKLQGFFLWVLLMGVITPVSIVSVTYLTEDWGNFFSKVATPDEALVDVSDSGINVLKGAKDASKDLFQVVWTRDPQALANSKNQVHWWIAYVSGALLFLSLIFKGGQNR